MGDVRHVTVFVDRVPSQLDEIKSEVTQCVSSKTWSFLSPNAPSTRLEHLSPPSPSFHLAQY